MLPEHLAVRVRAHPRPRERWALGLLLGGLGACASSPSLSPSSPASDPDPPAQAISQNAVVDVPAGHEPTASGQGAAGAAGATVAGPAGPSGPVTGRPRPPDGYVEMMVAGVAPTEDGEAVLLVDQERSVVVPIFVGNTEALAIELRYRKERFARPLTHDLLDSLMRELGGTLVKVQVDDIKGKTFVGSIFVRVGSRMIELDARPSDAIALALGSRVPIFVAKQVLQAGGIRKDGPTPRTTKDGPRT